MDPDFHRRDLADAIEAGAYPQWELGIQTFPDTPDQTFEGIDLLDPTKIVPEELAPVQPIGLLTLNANPINYFAETEQVAFHVGHLVPGIDVTDDPLLAGPAVLLPGHPDHPARRPQLRAAPDQPHRTPRSTTCCATACTRRPCTPGVAPYRPNSLDGGCPFLAGADGPGRSSRCPSRCPRRDEGARGPGLVRRPLQPAAPVLAEHDPGGARAHHRRVHLRAGQVLRAGRSRSAR